MPKIALGKTPEDLEREKAERERAIEEELQRTAQERHQKLEALHRAQKKYKMIILGVGGFIIGAILIFGIYNTFIKKNLNETDVSNIIASEYGGLIFPSDGAIEYIRDNGDTLIKKYMGANTTTVSDIEIDPDSYYILRIRKYSSDFVEVLFSVDIKANQPDIEVTNPEITSKVNVSGEGKEVKAKINGQDRVFYLRNGKLIQKGGLTTTRYNFTLPLTFKEIKDDKDNVIGTGYAPAGDLALYTLNENNQTDFTEDIEIDERYKFNKDAKLENKDQEAITAKVEKVIDDLYSGRDTSQDFIINKTFNSYGAKLDKVDSVETYNEKNQMGYNTDVRYSIITEQGFKIQIHTYMLVESSGNSYIITDML